MDGKLTIRQWVAIAFLLRLLVMPFTLQGDLLHVNKYPFFMAHGDWHVYERAASDGVNYYPPLALIFISAYQFLAQFLFPPFESFLRSIAESGSDSVISFDNLFFSLFLMKVPYLFFDGMLLSVGWKLLSNDEERRTFTVFWAVNPLAIYAPYMMGQIDLIPVFFTVLACDYSLQKGKENLACLSIAAGCLFKVFPIIFLPLVVLVAGRNLKDYLRLSLIAIVPVALVYGGFYWISGKAVFKIFLDVSYNFDASRNLQVVALRVVQAGIYALIAAHILFAVRKDIDYPLLVDYFLLIFLAVNGGIVVGFTHYWLWFLPFAVLFAIRQPRRRAVFYVLLTLIFLGGLRSRPAALGVFAPLNPEFFLSLPALQDVTGFLFDQGTYDSVIDLLTKAVLALAAVSILKNLYTTAHFNFDWRRIIAR
ncbi:MAG: hypothetical protein HZA02_09570 [Nitrospinae bacterium]|nr:hypothetical protein [Nitrospinota bacterium]